MDTSRFTHLIVIDLEATCDDRSLVPRTEMETIEIGAVLVAEDTLEPVDTFSTFIRPVRHPRLTPFCTRLTTITQGDVDAAPRFPDAIAALRRFLRGTTSLFCSWGAYDLNQLRQDARYHKIGLPFAEHLNLKEHFSDHLLTSKRFGMAGALARVGLRLEGTHHRGIDDARNIARLLPWSLGRAAPR
jgi:3'-5' exoribonuclease 1